MHERLRRREAERWALATDGLAKQERSQARDQIGERDVEKNRGPPPVERGDDGDQEPDRALRPDTREADEDVVQDADAMMDDPALEPCIEISQAGTSCFVDSISCCGSKGLPMNPCAPRAATSASSTLPLNMITGIDPTPWRSCTRRSISQPSTFGIITSSDVVDALADGRDPSTSLVGEVATAPLVTVTPGGPVAYAARLMRRANRRHLAVFNGREVVGILSSYDIVKAIGRWGSLAAGVDVAEEAEMTSAVTD